MTTTGFQYDRYVIEQLIRPMVNLYRVSAGEDGQPVAFVRQKRMALKEDIRAFRDESETDEVFRIKARRVVEIGGRYDVTDPRGELLGVLERRFARSLFRSTWGVLDADEQEIAWAQEQSMVIALLRRVSDLPLPFHFDIHAGTERIGTVTRAFSIRDRYVLELPGDPERRLDRRIAVALTLALDALQGR